MHGAAETLLLINIAAVHGLIVVQTIWATSADLVAGHRLTRSEIVVDDAALFRRLGELVPLIAGHLPDAVAA
jgi:hypothetical protein